MTLNQANVERLIRFFAGIALAVVAWVTWPGAVAIVSLAVAAIALATGLVGWCPAYALFNFSTRKRAGA